MFHQLSEKLAVS